MASPSGTVSKYNYRCLAQGTFRLLRLFGHATSNDCSVNDAADRYCKLQVQFVDSSFDDAIPHEALSYCWAGQERDLSQEEYQERSRRTRRILVSDCTGQSGFLMITTSLEAVLRSLVAVSDKPLFVDQLCINQEDNAEKSYLVGRMGEIYSKADRVLAWLGTATPEAEEFVDFMEELQKQPPAAFSRLADHDYRTFEIIRQSVIAPDPDATSFPDHLKPDRDVLRSMAIRMRENLPLRGLVDICSRQWFGRMWIVQEACLPANLQFVCGHRVWPANHFECSSLLVFMAIGHRAATTTADEVKRANPKIDDLIYALGLARFMNRLFGARRTVHGPDGTRMPLLDLLAKFNVADTATALTRGKNLQKFRAFDPRDCYYSLLALPEPTDAAVRRVAVDYQKSEAEVFTELAGALVENHTDVLLFSQNDCNKMSGLPSWVPDWSSDLALPFGYLQTNTPLFNAGSAAGGGFWEDTADPNAKGSVLEICGVEVGVVVRVGEHVPKVKFSEEDEPTEVSHHYFLSEIELFCRLARRKQEVSAAAPPCLDEAAWLMASGGRGLSIEQHAARRDRLGPRIHGVELLDAVYQIWRQDFEQKTRMHEWFRWQDPLVQCMKKKYDKWVALKARTSLYDGILYRLGIGEDWDEYDFYERFNRHWGAHGPVTEPGASNPAVGSHLPPEVREAASKATVKLGRAMDVQEGRRCFVTWEGHVGLGPRAMEVGDIIVVLKGASVPMVLRRWPPGSAGDGDLFTLSGEAYCYGVMAGELLERRGREEAKIFRLR